MPRAAKTGNRLDAIEAALSRANLSEFDLSHGLQCATAFLDAPDPKVIRRSLDLIQKYFPWKKKELMDDGGYASIADIEKTAALGTTVLAPPKQTAAQKAAGKDPYQPKKGDTPEVAAWRMRMGTAAAQALYRLRGQTAEWVNAGMRNRGLQQFVVRGLAKVRAVVLWHVLAHNLLRVVALRAQKGMSGEIPCA